MGVHAGDHAVYLDCREEFRDADMHAFKIGNWGSELVNFYTPYLEVNKYDILVDGANACETLGLDFNEIYKRTNTSYKPYPSGNSDYKSAASVERVEAFIKLGRPDPVQYEDEDGLASWDKVVAHVTKVLEEHKNKQPIRTGEKTVMEKLRLDIQSYCGDQIFKDIYQDLFDKYLKEEIEQINDVYERGKESAPLNFEYAFQPNL
jgi:hypothetical protein